MVANLPGRVKCTVSPQADGEGSHKETKDDCLKIGEISLTQSYL